MRNDEREKLIELRGIYIADAILNLRREIEALHRYLEVVDQIAEEAARSIFNLHNGALLGYSQVVRAIIISALKMVAKQHEPEQKA